MSHTVKIKAQFKIEQLESLKRAFEHFGWKIVENAKARTFVGDEFRDRIYPFVAVNPLHGYDIGLAPNYGTGEMEAFGDFYGGSVAKTLGENLDSLKQENACCVLEDYFAYHGSSSTRELEEDGQISVYGG